MIGKLIMNDKDAWPGSRLFPLPVEFLLKHGQQTPFGSAHRLAGFCARWLLLAGLAMPLAAGAQAKAPAAAPKEKSETTLPPAKEIIAKYVKALGGKDAILKYTSTHVKGAYEIPAQGITGTLEVFAAKPDKLKIKVDLPGLGQILSGYDGKVGWSIDPALGPMVMDGKRLDQLKKEANYYSALHDDNDFKSMETVELTPFEGKDCYKLKLVRQSGDEATEFYDTKTGLLLGIIASQESPLGSMLVTSTASDYKKFGNLLMAAKTIQKVAGIQQVMTVDSVEYNKVADSEFELPAPIKALVVK